MNFFSIPFIVFFIIVFVTYNSMPCRYKNYVLLAASIVFYACFDVKYLLVLLFVIALSFIVGIKLESGTGRSNKVWLALGVTIIIAILCFFKFWDYMLASASRLFGIGSESVTCATVILAPVGISFFTLEAIGYMVDVYRGTIKAERDFFKFALFISFFPKIMSGPIERSTNFLKQIQEGVSFNYDKVKRSFLLILWGGFIKILIANRLAIIVDNAFGDYNNQAGATLLFAVVVYGIQLYADFAGYSYMAIGMAGVFGYEFMDNFRQPYFAQDVRDFWTRWHISLSSWLRDYVYIPLGGNRKGELRKYFNLMITFIVSGLWHGVGGHYVLWGFIHGCYQVLSRFLGMPLEAVGSKLNIQRNCFSHRLLKAIVTFGLEVFTLLFFRAESIGAAFTILQKIIIHPELGRTVVESLFLAGADGKKYTVVLAELLLVFAIDIAHERKTDVSNWLNKQNKWFRWTVYIGMALCILIGWVRDYGIEASTFIYVNF